MYFKLAALCAVLVAAAAVSTAVAQDRLAFPQPAGKTGGTHSGDPWCGTAAMMNSPEGRAALRRFHEARANGTLPRVSKGQARQQVGAMQMFNIVTDSAWIPAQFELKATGTRFNVWLRSDQPDQPAVSDARIEEYRQALE
ncbi:MAG: hypothetical protein WBW88_18075, partial [Rhodothermales bacterium]